MPRLKQDDYIRKLDNDFKLAEEAEDEIQAVLAKFICVRLCGFVEVCLKERIQAFVDGRKSHSVISSYINNTIKGLTNLNTNKLRAALASFSQDWAEYYETNVTVEMKSTLGTIYTDRNTIAHGGNVSISLSQLKRHYENLKGVAALIEKAVSK